MNESSSAWKESKALISQRMVPTEGDNKIKISSKESSKKRKFKEE